MLLMLLGFTLVTAQQTVTIKGTVKGDLKGHTRIYVYGKGVKIDTAFIKNGSFEMTLPFTKPFSPLFYDEYDVKVKQAISPFPIIIDQPGTVYLNDIDIEKGLYSGKISGIKSAVDFQSYNDGQEQIFKEIRGLLQKKYGDSVKPESSNYNAYMSDMDSMSTAKGVELVKSFVKLNPDTYTSTYILNGMKSSIGIEDLEKLYALLSKKTKESENGKAIGDYIGGVKKSGIGQTVADFTLNDANDQPLNFGQMKGKYVIIDFWASWCGPCKASFPHMKELYSKYKDDRFEIYSISIDQSKSEWLKELKKQELPWLQTLDTKKISTTQFAVTAVPTTFMIDPQGKIILKEVGLDPSGKGPLDKKLVELFGTK